MPIFNYYQDQKQTIWTRTFFTVNANTEKEAISILKQYNSINIEDLEEQFPDITRYGKILKIGIHDVDSDFPGARAWPGYDMPSTTSIKNLYNVGEGVQAPGWSGTNKAAETARQVAGAVSKTINI